MSTLLAASDHLNELFHQLLLWSVIQKKIHWIFNAVFHWVRLCFMHGNHLTVTKRKVSIDINKDSCLSPYNKQTS